MSPYKEWTTPRCSFKVSTANCSSFEMQSIPHPFTPPNPHTHTHPPTHPYAHHTHRHTHTHTYTHIHTHTHTDAHNTHTHTHTPYLFTSIWALTGVLPATAFIAAGVRVRLTLPNFPHYSDIACVGPFSRATPRSTYFHHSGGILRQDKLFELF